MIGTLRAMRQSPMATAWGGRIISGACANRLVGRCGFEFRGAVVDLVAEKRWSSGEVARVGVLDTYVVSTEVVPCGTALQCVKRWIADERGISGRRRRSLAGTEGSKGA